MCQDLSPAQRGSGEGVWIEVSQIPSLRSQISAEWDLLLNNPPPSCPLQHHCLWLQTRPLLSLSPLPQGWGLQPPFGPALDIQ